MRRRMIIFLGGEKRLKEKKGIPPPNEELKRIKRIKITLKKPFQSVRVQISFFGDKRERERERRSNLLFSISQDSMFPSWLPKRDHQESMSCTTLRSSRFGCPGKPARESFWCYNGVQSLGKGSARVPLLVDVFWYFPSPSP